MGYYTDFEIYYNVEDEDTEEAIGQMISGITGRDTYRSGTMFSAKWYGFDSDMCMLSANFPDVEFILNGDGEESGDVWTRVYKNGVKIATKISIIVLVDATKKSELVSVIEANGGKVVNV